VLRVLQLRQMRQKKAEVHTGSPGVAGDALGRKASRPGRAQSFSARRLASARFPQCNSKGSGITDNCHCQTSELLIVTAADPRACIEPVAQTRSGFKGFKARMCRSARRAQGATNEPCRKRASIRAGLRRDVGHPRRSIRSRRCGVGRRYSRVHEDLLLDAHHLPGWQDGG
jgi:hypothetical protein